MRSAKRSFVRKLVLLLTLMLCGALVLSVRVWSVSLVENSCVTRDEIVQFSHTFPAWLWQMEEKEITSHDVPCLVRLQFVPKYPGRLELRVQQREGTIKLTPDSATSSAAIAPTRFIADQTGYVFRVAETEDSYPEILIARPVVVGDSFPALGKFAWPAVFLQLRTHLGPYNQVFYTRSGDLEIRLARTTVLLPVNDTLSNRITLVASILSRASADGTIIRTVDYRFDRPILSY